jgi:hypothetical protein
MGGEESKTFFVKKIMANEHIEGCSASLVAREMQT